MYVEGILNQHITCSFITKLPGLFGNLLLVAWVFLGLLLNPLGATFCGFLEYLGRERLKRFNGVETPLEHLKDNFIESLSLTLSF